MNIANLRERLTLEQPVRTPDGGGGAAVTWQTVTELWAYVRPISGDERLAHDQLSGRLTHEVWIRYRAGVLPAMRFTQGAAHLRDRRRHRGRAPFTPQMPVRGALAMKVTVTARGTLDNPAVRTRLIETLSRNVLGRLALELEEELRIVRASGGSADAEARRDALARAVRRHFGTPL